MSGSLVHKKNKKINKNYYIIISFYFDENGKCETTSMCWSLYIV